MGMTKGKYDPQSEQPTLNEAVQNFDQRLKRVIGKQSVAAFAKDCGIDAGIIRKYLKTKTTPGIDKVAAISEATGNSLVWLITGAGSQYKDDNQPKAEHLSEEEFNKWWGIIADTLTPEKKLAVVSTFKQGGFEALFSTELFSDKNK